MKSFPLVFIQVAWVCETIAIILFTMLAVIILKADQINLWLQFIPALSILIGAQGTAAGLGPIASERIKAGGHNGGRGE